MATIQQANLTQTTDAKIFISNPNVNQDKKKKKKRRNKPPQGSSQAVELLGILKFAQNSQILIDVCVGLDPNPIEFKLDTGSSYSQIDSGNAAKLKSHPKLLGRSTIGNGDLKWDYLAPTQLSVLGVEVPLLLKVGPNQPNLLGLDFILRSKMKIFPFERKFLLSSQILKPDETFMGFSFLSLKELLQVKGIEEQDLVDIKSLAPPRIAAQQFIDAGQTHFVDLGTTMSFFIPDKNIPMFNLGTA